MKRLRIALAAFAALVLGGCGGDSIQSPDFTQVLLRLAVTAEPAQPAGGVPVGRDQQFVARGEYSLPPGSNPATDIRSEPVEGVVWSSSNPSVATIDAATGLATAVAVGTTTIRAVGDDVEGTAVMTVTAAAVESLTIVLNPPSSSIPVGGSRVARAVGVFSDGSTQDVISTWTSSDTQRVSVGAGPSETSSVQALSVGNSTIRATAVANPSLFAQLQVTVQQRVTSLTVQPDSAATPLGRPFQFTVTGTGQNSVGGPSVPLVPGDFSVRWSVANSPASQGGSTSPVAGIDPDTGVANGVRVGTAIVTAAAVEDGISDTAALEITPPVIDRLALSLDSPTICQGLGRPLTANAVLTNGQQSPQRVQWLLENSSPAGVVSFNPNPAATTTVLGEVSGNGTIRANAIDADGAPVLDDSGLQLTVTTPVTVIPQDFANPNCQVDGVLRVDPAAATVRENGTTTFRALVDDAQGNAISIPATWVSSDVAVATIDSNTGVATGEMESATAVTITATANVPGSPVNGDTATASLRVTSEVCTTPLLASEGVLAQSIIDPFACPGCFITNPGNAIDGVPTTFSTVFAALGLLGGEATLRAQTQNIDPPLRSYPFPFQGGDNAGFVIARPVGALVLAEVFSQVQVRTALGGVIQESSGGPTAPPNGIIPLPLRVDLLGQAVNGQYDLALVSIRTSTPYDAIDLTFNSGTATALSDVLVFQACGTAELPQVADLVQVERVEPTASTLVVGGTRDYVLMGRYSNGTVAPIPDSDVDWTSSNAGVASVANNGLVSGVSAGGPVTITGTLKTGVAATGGVRSAAGTVSVIANVCSAPLLASDTPAATISRTLNGLCLLCSTSNLPNVIDDPINTFGSLNVPVGLLNGGVSVTVRANRTITPTAGNRAGFVITRPDSPVVQAELLSQLVVETLLNGVVQSTTGLNGLVPLRLGLLGVDFGGGEQLLASVPAATAFDAVRLTFNSGLLTADLDQLNNINMFRACSSVDPSLLLP